MDTKRLVLTRDATANRAWGEILELRGIPTYELPCIQTVPTALTPAIRTALGRFQAYSWAVFTSAAGVRHFATLAVDSGLDRRTLTNVWYAAIGNQTADAIKSLGLVVRFTPSQATGATLARELKKVKGREIILLHTNIAPPEAAGILRRRGAHVIDLPVYQTLPITTPDPQFTDLLLGHDIGGLIFASPSAVAAFTYRLIDAAAFEIARGLPTAAIGPSVASALSVAGFRDIRTAPRPSLEGVLEVLT